MELGSCSSCYLSNRNLHRAGFVEVFELFKVDDLFGEEVGVVQIADEVEQVFLCFGWYARTRWSVDRRARLQEAFISSGPNLTPIPIRTIRETALECAKAAS
jgi:hypothetical protein